MPQAWSSKPVIDPAMDHAGVGVADDLLRVGQAHRAAARHRPTTLAPSARKKAVPPCADMNRWSISLGMSLMGLGEKAAGAAVKFDPCRPAMLNPTMSGRRPRASRQEADGGGGPPSIFAVQIGDRSAMRDLENNTMW